MNSFQNNDQIDYMSSENSSFISMLHFETVECNWNDYFIFFINSKKKKTEIASWPHQSSAQFQIFEN